MKTKGQLIGQVFIFLLGAFVVGGVLLIGYRAIANLGEQQCRVQGEEFARDLQNAFDAGMLRGRVRTHTFDLPCGATAVCLVERRAIDERDTSYGNLLNPQYSIISNSIESGESSSVWVLQEGGYTRVDAINNALPIHDFDSSGSGGGIECFEGTAITLRLEGRGQSVSVTEATP